MKAGALVALRVARAAAACMTRAKRSRNVTFVLSTCSTASYGMCIRGINRERAPTAVDAFTADASPAAYGHACHSAVKAKDYIFHPYQKR